MSILKRLKRSVSYSLRMTQSYHSECAEQLAMRNWSTLRRMSLLYLGYLLVYLLTVCPYLAIPIQTTALRISVLVQGVFCAGVYLRDRSAPSPKTVNIVVSFFAFEILGLSGFIGISVFPSAPAFSFPLVLILITQLYDRPIGYTAFELSVSVLIYLACSYHIKSMDAFVLDVIGVMIALGIAMVAYHNRLGFGLRAYRAQRSLQKMCEIDQMTGVNNKTTFQYRVEQYMQSMNRAPSAALAVCDLDDFKSVNDRYGHRRGDEVIKAFAQNLRAIAEQDPGVIAGRFGGDEFVVFFKNGADKESVLEKLRTLCRIDGFEFAATCSIGVAFARHDAVTFDELFDRADTNAYHAKQKGRGNICAFPEEDG